MRQTDWWDEHIVAALMSYWVYQHLGNLSPEAQRDYELLQRVKAAGDGGEILREFAERAERADRRHPVELLPRRRAARGVVVVDSRAGRVLEEGRRSMVDEEEWEWITEHATGDFDHLLIATSLPFLLGRGMHYVEAWSEAVAGGAWGRLAARLGRARCGGAWTSSTGPRSRGRSTSWPSFSAPSARASAAQAPASIVTLSGDVHHAYLCEVGFPRGSGVRSAVWQAVCSPYRNPLDSRERRVIRIGMSRPVAAVARLLARAAGVADPKVDWRQAGDGPWFDNQVATLTPTAGRSRCGSRGRFRWTRPSARLECVLERRLA